MDDVEPVLFDLPELEPGPTPQSSPARPRRGRNREKWARTVTAAVSIVDAAFRVLEVDSAVAPEASDRAAFTWTVWPGPTRRRCAD